MLLQKKIKMEKRVVIIHGWEGSPESNWLPWLKEQVEGLGYKAVVPAMPNPNLPVMTEWLDKLRSVVDSPDKNIYLVGHSLGATVILRYLELLPGGKKAGGVVLVAGFPEPIGYKELSSFFEKPLDYEKVKQGAKRFVAIHSDDDPYVPMKDGEVLRDRLGAELIVMNKGGHLNAASGFTKLPVVLEKLNELMQEA